MHAERLRHIVVKLEKMMEKVGHEEIDNLGTDIFEKAIVLKAVKRRVVMGALKEVIII